MRLNIYNIVVKKWRLGKKYRGRRIVTGIFAAFLVAIFVISNPASYEQIFTKTENTGADYETSARDSGADESENANENADLDSGPLASEVLEKLEVKGRAPKTNYSREQFYSGWPTVDGCSLRQRIIKREFGDTAKLDGCNVISGEYDEPYTGEHKIFNSKEEIADGVQIDHVVALSDAWQKGAQYFDADTRYRIATDPLNLLAVDASTNMKKSDGDAATWLPPNKKFRCEYVARQVSVKYKYKLWVTEAEKAAISKVLESCPNEKAVGVDAF